MKKYRLITACLLILLALLLFNIFNRNRNSTIETFNADATTKEEAEYTIAGLGEKDAITEEDGGMRAYPLFPFDPVRNVEVFYIEFDAGVCHDSLPHVTGVEEYIFWCMGC